MELSEETKKNIKEYEKDIKEGRTDKFTSLEKVKEELTSKPNNFIKTFFFFKLCF